MSIEIVGLWKAFGSVTAVTDINLDVSQGEMLVLLGPSGCGKTTTMRCIAGLETPSRGRVAIGGRVVFDDRKNINVAVNQRNIGMVFQSYAIWPHMTVFENVAFPLAMARLGGTEISKRVGEILALVGLEGFAARGASYLSGGQMQRVALARSLVMRPSVLLFDEPMSNLDARLRDRLRIQLREIQTQLKITSVYVTHDQREALALADQIAVMQGGTILQTGDPISVYTRPRTSTVADFLGYSNIFAARIVERTQTSCLVELEQSGHRMRLAAIAADAGAPLSACIRPEDVTIRHAAAGTGGGLTDNVLTGEVILTSFMGSYMQYRVRVNGGQEWEASSSGIFAAIRPHSPVVLEIAPDNVLLLPSS